MIMMPLGPILMRELGVGTHEFGLLVSSYTFSAAFTGLLAAMFVDRFERKRLLLTMFALFAVATLACGLAPGYWTLLAARGTAGAFGGVLGSMVQTMVGDLIPSSGAAAPAAPSCRPSRFPPSPACRFHSISPIISAGASPSFHRRSWPAACCCWAGKCCRLRGHLPDASVSETERAHPLAAMAAVLRDANHLSALLFMALIMFSGFTVIPYITIYITANVEIRQQDIPLIYLFGGCATFFHLAPGRPPGRRPRQDQGLSLGRAVFAGTLFVQTHLWPVPLWVMIFWSTVFFIFVPGRMVPAMAIVTSAVQPRLRGTFLSMNGAVQQLASGVPSWLGGAMIAADATGRIVGYDRVGYLAMGATLAAMAFVGQIDMHTGKPPNVRPG
jgi:predicted MFS family arabinose efflux permease